MSNKAKEFAEAAKGDAAHGVQEGDAHRLGPHEAHAQDEAHGAPLRRRPLNEAGTRTAIIAKKKEVLRAWCRSVVDIDELTELRALIEGSLGG